MSEPKNEPYSPEPGSSLHDIKRTEELGRIQDEETEESRTRERLVREMYEEMGNPEQETKELTMDWTHVDRVRAGQIAKGYEEKSFNEIENEAYHDWLRRNREGDNRPTAEVYSDFYGKIYPQYGPYLEQRRQQDSQVMTETVLEDFLQGADLRTSKPK